MVEVNTETTSEANSETSKSNKDAVAARPIGVLGSGVRREVRAAVLVSGVVLLLSAIAGVGWGMLAPAEHLLVTAPGRGIALPGESMHQFDAMAIFMCIGAVLGILSGVAAWRWRTIRGPILQLGLLAGSVAGAVAMWTVGEQVAVWQHPRSDDPAVGEIVSLPPEVGGMLALIIQPLLASLVVLLLAALSPSEDLGSSADLGAKTA